MRFLKIRKGTIKKIIVVIVLAIVIAEISAFTDAHPEIAGIIKLAAFIFWICCVSLLIRSIRRM